MAVPGYTILKNPFGVKGIQYYPASSSNVSTPSTGIGFIGATEKGFTFTSTQGSNPYRYLTLDLLEYSNPTQSLNITDRDRYVPNAVIVKGHIMPLPAGDYETNIDEIDTLYFEHVFLTDWHSSSVWTPISSIYSFEDQNNINPTPPSNPTSTNTWNVTGTHTGWVNGLTAVAGSTFVNGLTTRGWNIGVGGTYPNANGTGTPSNSTGPSGGVIGDGITPGGSSSGAQKFLYTESSSPNNTTSVVWVVRTPGINISASMADPTNNSARLRFKVHAYGSVTGELKVYYDTLGQSTSTQATLLESYAADAWTNESGTSPYANAIIDLPTTITQTDDDYYFFITHRLSGNSFTGDLAIDRVVFEEQVTSPNYTQTFYQDVASGDNGTLVTDGDPFIDFRWGCGPTDTASVVFSLFTNEDEGAYIKGTYLLL